MIANCKDQTVDPIPKSNFNIIIIKYSILEHFPHLFESTFPYASMHKLQKGP